MPISFVDRLFQLPITCRSCVDRSVDNCQHLGVIHFRSCSSFQQMSVVLWIVEKVVDRFKNRRSFCRSFTESVDRSFDRSKSCRSLCRSFQKLSIVLSIVPRNCRSFCRSFRKTVDRQSIVRKSCRSLRPTLLDTVSHGSY